MTGATVAGGCSGCGPCGIPGRADGRSRENGGQSRRADRPSRRRHAIPHAQGGNWGRLAIGAGEGRRARQVDHRANRHRHLGRRLLVLRQPLALGSRQPKTTGPAPPGGIARSRTAGARERMAGPNDVLASSTLRDLVIGSGLEFEERGSYELTCRRVASVRGRPHVADCRQNGGGSSSPRGRGREGK
jgi:hypothetical protein